MAAVISLTDFDLRQENLNRFLASRPILAQILRQMIIDRILQQIPVETAVMSHIPTASGQGDATVQQHKIQQFKLKMWGDQIGQYFLQRKGELDQIVYSMIRTPDPGLTQELYFRIQAQEDSFADLAQTYSQGSEAMTNGVIGPVAIANLPAPIAEKLLSLQPGKVASPVKLQNQFVIFKLERIIPAQLNPAMQQMLLNELFETWLQAEITKQIAQLRSTKLQQPEPILHPTLQSHHLAS
jgi:parvulin-like peptidyl-prolyl isomerase